MTTIAVNSIETVSNLIRKEFNKLPYFMYEGRRELIQSARDFNLIDLANELQEIENNF